MKSIRNKLKKHIDILAIVFYCISIIMYIISLFINKNPLFSSLGCMFFVIGLTFFLYDRDKEKHKPIRGFQIVIPEKRKTNCVHMPTRSSKNSAGYDFYADKDYNVLPNEIIKIWTDIKAYMQPDEFLMLDVRSSMGGKYMLANTIGIIDSDYYSNPDNDGNIGIFLKNISNTELKIFKGDKIAQGIFMKYLKADKDNTTKERKGGFGSSGR
jgi:dUTP pyrophosphatase